MRTTSTGTVALSNTGCSLHVLPDADCEKRHYPVLDIVVQARSTIRPPSSRRPSIVGPGLYSLSVCGPGAATQPLPRRGLSSPAVFRSLRTNSHCTNESSRSGPSPSVSSTQPFPPPAAPSRSLTMRAKAAAAQRSGAASPLTSPQYGTRTMRRARWGRDYTGGDVATIVLDRPAMRRAR